jgi:hypothetical protein
MRGLLLRRLGTDGGASARVADEEIDCRSSCCPLQRSPVLLFRCRYPRFCFEVTDQQSMTELMKWEGCLLRGQVESWLLENFTPLPIGSPVTGPFGTREWWVGFADNDRPNELSLYCDEPLEPDCYLTVSFTVLPPRGLNTLAKEVQFGVERAETGHQVLFLGKVDMAQIQHHAKCGSTFEMNDQLSWAAFVAGLFGR